MSTVVQKMKSAEAFKFLARDCVVRTNRRAIAMMFVGLSVRL